MKPTIKNTLRNNFQLPTLERAVLPFGEMPKAEGWGVSISKLIISLSVMILSLFGNQMMAQNAEAYTKIDTNAIIIGDQIGLEFGISMPVGFTTIWPSINDTITANIEVISKTEIDTLLDADQMILSQRLTITSFDSGYFEIPGFSFIFGKEGDSLAYSSESSNLYLQVFTPEVDTSQAFKIIKAPYAEPYTFMEIFPWVLGGLLIIGIIVFVIWFIARRKKNKSIFTSKPKPLRPPQEVALEKLESLRLAKVWQQGMLKSYHSQLTDIAREYLHRRFSFDALEMTSEEIISELKNHKVNAEVLNKLNAAFTLSDLVKFAKAQPTALENDLSHSHCVDFVNETALIPEIVKEEENNLDNNLGEGGSDV